MNPLPFRKCLMLGWVVGLLLGLGREADAAVVFSGSTSNSMSGQELSATAAFDLINGGTQLQVALSNLGDPVLNASDILTAVFFNLNGVGTLTPVSAVLNTGSVLLNGPLSSGSSLGDNWEYLGGLSGAPGGLTQGISAAGFGLFGMGNFGSNPQNVDGSPYGIINGTGALGNDHIPTMQLENNSMVFTLGGLPANFSLGDVTAVSFQYGTTLSPSEPLIVGHVVPAPEPSVAAFGLLAAALLGTRRPEPQGRRRGV